jgi:2-methylisocitrate lyase-like PEP mutase family enzyme
MVRSALARLRRLLAQGRMVAAPGACDPFTARLIERAGFEAVYLGGNAMGLSLAKGQPLITLTETVDYAAKIVRTTDLPLIVDAGAGFGSPAHVHRTVIEIESTGAAAMHIDDQPYPKRPSYHRGDGGLAPVDEAAARLRVAANAKRDPDFLIVARTDALRVTGSLDEAIARGRAYAADGIDALMVLDLEPAQVAPVRAALPGMPLVWIGGVVPPVPSLRELEAANFAIAVYPFNTIAAVAVAVGELWAALKETGEIKQEGALLTRMRRELAEIAGMETYWRIEDELARQPVPQKR